MRRDNEDNVMARPDEGLWAVADGMGGHANGKWSSKTIVNALDTVLMPSDFDEASKAAAGAVHRTNEQIWRKAGGQPMGSTVVVLLLRERRFAVFWAGDSRCYLLRGRQAVSADRRPFAGAGNGGVRPPDASRKPKTIPCLTCCRAPSASVRTWNWTRCRTRPRSETSSWCAATA
ncbi:PP2C family protein-serine/threonine phosphatase [Caulobacter segnis]